MKCLGKERPCKDCNDTKKPEDEDCPNAWFYRNCLLELAEELEYCILYPSTVNKMMVRKLAKQIKMSIGVKK